MSQEQFERIDSYLSGMMDDNDLEKFELELKNSPSLQESVENIRADILAIQEVSLRETLDDIHDNMSAISIEKERKEIRNVNWLKRLGVAASIGLLVGLGALWMSKSSPSNEKLFAEYYSPDPGLITPMSTTNNYEFFRAMVDYKKGDYDLALNSWNKQILEKPQNDSLNFFIGMAMMAQNKFDDAKPYLKIVSKSSKSIFIPEVHYYIGLLELRDGNIEIAKKEIQKSGFENATTLVQKINDL